MQFLKLAPIRSQVFLGQAWFAMRALIVQVHARSVATVATLGSTHANDIELIQDQETTMIRKIG